MKLKVLVSQYVTMDVDTDDIDVGCRMISNAVAEATSAFSEGVVDVDYPEILDSDSYDYDSAYEFAREEKLFNKI